MDGLDLILPTSDRITGGIEQFCTQTLTEVFSPKFKQYQEFIKLLEKEPIAAKCSQLKILRSQISLGEYVHKDKEKQDFIRSCFSTMQGNLRQTVGQLGSAMALGFSIGEIVFTNRMPGFRRQWRLKGIYPLNPKRVSFKGRLGETERVIYYNKNNFRSEIPYNKFIHIVNTGSTGFDQNLLWGVGDCEAALNYYKIKLIILAEMTHAAKNNGSSHIWGRTDTSGSIKLLDSKGKEIIAPNGKPLIVSKQRGLTYQLEQLPNSNIIVTDNDTVIQPLQFNSGERFWEYVLQAVEKNIYLSFGIPPTLFSEGSSTTLGNVGLSENHKSILDASVEGFVTNIKEALIENVVRPLLVWNFGETKDFGEFKYNASEDGATINGRISTILSAIASGVFSPDDSSIQEKLREWLNLPPLSDEEKQAAMEQRAVQENLKMLSNQAQISQAREAVSADPLSPSNPINAAAKEDINLNDVPAVQEQTNAVEGEDYTTAYP